MKGYAPDKVQVTFFHDAAANKWQVFVDGDAGTTGTIAVWEASQKLTSEAALSSFLDGLTQSAAGCHAFVFGGGGGYIVIYKI
jgi:hypothetical protein